ncbi:hypothetical protein [Croceiramulus getboli]|nr:hypothetical protein P8624_11970 [Flavobacteriaceae bacterium YJPT1-3]
MKTYITLILFAIFSIHTVTAQDVYLQGEVPEAIDEQARKLTDRYISELAISGEMQPIFEQKVVEFLMRREEVKEKYEGKAMLDRLFLLSKEENGEMRNILTQPQLRRYRRIKKKIQPIAVVED